ncbi:NACHT domain-containing NTPase [Mucilaginibacter sp. Mucisp86]|uniref:NACHT domain-containing protein n=1 Tax=Mucilaginibacter sp. Mucisp86 TaxID=3243060 RepID=UPI0039B3BB33
MADNLATKDIITASAPIIKLFVDTFLSKKLEKVKDELSLEYKKNIIGIEKYLTEYFERTYTKYSVINTLVFSNSEKLLKDLFIPLTIKEVSEKERKKKYKIDGFPIQLAIKYKKVLITDTAGMGKSTLVKRILLDVIDNSIGIPIIIELRRLNKDKTILKELHEQLSSINKLFDEKLLLELLTQGDFIFFLDGFDEIPLSDRDKVAQDLQQFTSKANGNRFFMTSRPESALSGFGEFQQFSIEPLNKNEAYKLLKNYDKNGKISTLLIKKLKETEFRNIEEFLVNPLLVSLLFTAFEYKQVIPFKKHLFYRQVYDANFESHDLTKGDSYMHDKYSKLDIDDFHRVLRFIGYSCLQVQKIEFSKDELLNLISKSLDFCSGLKFKESDFLKDVISTVPLFTKDGIYYRWSHKSLQEYFAAQFIYLDSKQMQTKILEKISQNRDTDTYYNVLDIYYDIDYKSFRDIIIFPLLKELISRQEKLQAIRSDVIEDELITFNECTFSTSGQILYVGDDWQFEDEPAHSFMKKHAKNNNGVQIAHRLLSDTANHKELEIASLQAVDNRRLNILLILRSKKSEILKYRKYSKDSLRIEYPLLTKFRLLIDRGYLVIDDDSILKNTLILDNLNLINKILIDAVIFETELSYIKAKEMIKLIEQETTSQSNTESLLSGL